MNENIYSISRLKWACRRGMLELDLILGNFLDRAWPSLDDLDKQRFIDLLECNDPVLFDYLSGQILPENPDMALIVEKIRLHAKSSI